VQLNIVRIGSKDIDFILDIDENLPVRAVGDELRLKQILNNLLSNAIKYTDAGHVKLTVNHLMDNGELILRFVIEDTGQGMKPEDLENLFAEYSRFNTEANRTTEGTGLGMSITKRLVNMMDGDIMAESEYMKGTTIKVEVKQKAVECGVIGLALKKQLCDFSYQGNIHLGNQNIVFESMPHGRVLVVDDLEINLYVAKGLMAPYKLNIDLANDGFEALDKVTAGESYDIIFMDHMMPRMDGMETTAKIRETGYTQPIVALTANTVAGQAEIFLANGFDDFISKPIDIRQLNTVLKKYIRDRQPADYIPAKEQPMHPPPYEKLKDIELLDVNAALEAMNGMFDVYMGTLKLTMRLLPGRMDTMDRFLAEEDIGGFKIEVHGIKSVLKNIGAAPLSEQAAALEKAAMDNDQDFCREHYPAFRAALVILADRLNEAIPSSAPEGKGTADKTAFAKALSEAREAAENYDSDLAIGLIAPYTDFAYDNETEEALKKIVHALEVFNCEEAINHIDSIIT
jgi:CheY-like chemotaxis protein/anti-sigma regulatory factor (Ser/Thr protein kinase)